MQRSPRIWVVVLALALVVPVTLVALFSLIVVPSWADIEVLCTLSESSHTIDVYFNVFTVVILVTAITTVGLMVALVGRIKWRILLPPIAWLGAILVAEYLVALAIGPQDCVGGIDW